MRHETKSTSLQVMICRQISAKPWCINKCWLKQTFSVEQNTLWNVGKISTIFSSPKRCILQRHHSFNDGINQSSDDYAVCRWYELVSMLFICLNCFLHKKRCLCLCKAGLSVAPCSSRKYSCALCTFHLRMLATPLLCIKLNSTQVNAFADGECCFKMTWRYTFWGGHKYRSVKSVL